MAAEKEDGVFPYKQDHREFHSWESNIPGIFGGISWQEFPGILIISH